MTYTTIRTQAGRNLSRGIVRSMRSSLAGSFDVSPQPIRIRRANNCVLRTAVEAEFQD